MKPKIHPQAICESPNIGNGTTIWAFTHILRDAEVGRDCNICDHVFIENKVKVGHHVTIKSGVQLWDGIRLEDHVFVGPNVSFTNDPFPRSKQHLQQYPQTIVKKHASIGGGATILPNIQIGEHAMVGAGAVVTKDVPSYAIVIGNPAEIIGYTDKAGRRSSVNNSSSTPEVPIKGVTIIQPTIVNDIRGSLEALEVNNQLPFIPKRIFTISNVPNHHVRGQHALKNTQLVMCCLKGACRVTLDNGKDKIQYRLSEQSFALHIAPKIWITHQEYRHDAVLLVIASKQYAQDEYIRDYQEFIKQVS